MAKVAHVAAAPQVPRYLRPLNQRQINQQANKQLAAEMAAARAPIVSAQAAAQQRQAAAQQALAGFGQAAMGMYTKPADVQQAYKDAAAEQAGFASGITGAAGQMLQTSADANKAFLDQQAPGAAPSAAPSPDAVTNAEQYLGGYNPASSIAAEGAAAAGTAAGLPTLQAARTEQDMMASQAKAQQDDQQFVQDMLDLAAKEPSLRNQIMTELYNRETQKANQLRQDQAQQLYEAQFGQKVQQDAIHNRQENQRIAQGNARIALSQAGLRLSIAKQKFAVSQALKDGRRIDSSASRAAGHLVDRNGNAITDKNGKPIPVQASSGSSKSNQGTNSTGYHEAVRATHSLIIPKPVTGNAGVLYKYYAKPGKGKYVKGSGWFTNDPNQAQVTYKYDFPTAVNYMMNAYGLTRAAARKALIAGGMKPNGKRPKK